MPKPTLGLVDAVFVGLAAMLGAGLFVVFAPASALAGEWLPLAVAIAGLVAYLNAGSIAQLARVVTRSGGAYSYARHYLNPHWGYAAGAAFLIGKIGSAAAVALTVGNYLWPEAAVPIALGSLAVMTTINIMGVNRTAFGSKILAGITIAFLATILIWSWLLPPLALAQTTTVSEIPAVIGVPTAAALMFFAFAGYARVATLGGEVREPERNLPRAIAISLAIVLALYLALAVTLQQTLGPGLALTVTPIADLANRLGIELGLVAAIAATAALGSLLALLAGMGRTAATMAEDGELPAALARTARSGAPWLAETVIASLAALLVLSQDLVWTIGFSSFAVLSYYAIANLAAIRQPETETSRPKFLNWMGLAICLLLALSVPPNSLLLGLAALALAFLVRWGLAHRGRSD